MYMQFRAERVNVQNPLFGRCVVIIFLLRTWHNQGRATKVNQQGRCVYKALVMLIPHKYSDNRAPMTGGSVATIETLPTRMAPLAYSYSIGSVDSAELGRLTTR